MPRMMSFALTTQQILDRTKTVTRRNGWTFLKVGDVLQAVEKAQGLKKGEQVKRLALIKVKQLWLESLNAITPDEVIREGFTHADPVKFIEMYCAANNCPPGAIVRRIGFIYLNPVDLVAEPVRDTDLNWIKQLASKSTAFRLDHLPMYQLMPFEEILERYGVSTDDLTGNELLSDLITQTGLFSHLYEV